MMTVYSQLPRVLRGAVLTPPDAAYDAARQTWVRAELQEPAAIVVPHDAADFAVALTFASERGMPVAVQCTGHGLARPCDGGLLINTARLCDARIDPERRLAAVGPGVRWGAVLGAAHRYGLTGSCGNTPHLGVVGYTLRGGISWTFREHGYAADALVAAELVTADGRRRRVSEDERPELFWALRGGGEHLGVVTSLTFRLLPYAEVYGGVLVYPITRAREVLARYREWTEELPTTITSSIVLQHVPDVEAAPPPLRGQSVVLIEACAVGDLASSERLIDRIRVPGALVDTFTRLRTCDLGRIANEPADPQPSLVATETLAGLPDPFLDMLLTRVSDRRQTSLFRVELRHVASPALALPVERGAVGRWPARFALIVVATAPTAPDRTRCREEIRALLDACAPYRTGGLFANLVGRGQPEDARATHLFSPAAAERLRHCQAQCDPAHLFRFTLPIGATA